MKPERTAPHIDLLRGDRSRELDQVLGEVVTKSTDTPEEAEININETLSRVCKVVARRRWWILGLGAGISLGTISALLVLPDHYTSEATLLVVQQQVPERYVVPNSTTDLTAALNAMKREVLSRPKLLKIVDDFDLYEEKRKKLAPETIAELMLRDIEIQPLDENPTRRDFTAFKISFIAESPVLAQRVATTLTSLFITENLRTREEQSVTTTAFLHDQVEEKRRALDAEEKQLRDLKLRFMGELPEQQEGNLGILSGLQGQLQHTESSLTHAQEQRVYLESLLNGYLAQATGEVNQLRAKRAKLLEMYTPKYPAVVKLDGDIAAAESVVRRLLSDSPVEAESAGSRTLVTATPTITEQPAAAQVRSQLNANRLEIENLSKEEVKLKAEIGQYQDRLNEAPRREQQLLAVTRDVEQFRQQYAELGKKEQESQLATNLEKNQGGQQFRLVEPPTLPVIPSSPKRLKLSLLGTAGGFAVGIALALFLEVKDRCFYTEGEASNRLTVPMLIGVPLLFTPAEERALRRRSVFEWIAGCFIVLTICAAEAFIYRRG